MADYRSMFDREYIGAWDVAGKDVTLTIASVTETQLIAQGNKKSKRPVLRFEKAEKGMVMNKTNCRIVAEMYGTDVVNWIGKRITLYATTTSMGRETVECIRVRTKVGA